MKRVVVFSVVLLAFGLILSRISSSIASAAQPNASPGVRRAIINSPKALELSTEGQELDSRSGRISKKKRDEEIKRIRSEMVAIVETIAKEKGYGLIFDLQTAGIITDIPPVDDLMQELVDRYNSSKRWA
jgi:Skp family chaperone for outer membrane proteins